MNQLQLSQPVRPPNRTTFAEENDPQRLQEFLTASSTVGMLLVEICLEPGMGLDEFRVASSLCFPVIRDSVSGLALPEIARLSRLSQTAARKALQKLSAAGFIRVERSWDFQGLFYCLQFRPDFKLS